MSLWPVEVESTVQLVQSFLKHRKEGRAKLQSLHDAREEIRKKYDHPYFWAAFVLVGETD
jgi:CHAT domain-containing protein